VDLRQCRAISKLRCDTVCIALGLEEIVWREEQYYRKA